MNENINLYEILKDCPQGTKFYSPILGEVTFMGIDWDFHVIKIIDNKKSDWHILHDGHMIISCIKTEEVIFFPSKDQHDWSKFKAPWLKKPKFDPKTLQTFDNVLVRDDESCKWRANFYSHEDESMAYPFRCIGKTYTYCIPYNDDTKHLVGTKDEAPEYYRYWEE